MYTPDDSFNSLSPEKRQRVENAFQSFGSGGFQGMNPASEDALNTLSPEKRQRVEDALRSLGEHGLQGMSPTYIVQQNGTPGQYTQQSSSPINLHYTREGDSWAHWEYAPDEWKLFDQIDWHFQPLLFWVLLLGTLISLGGAIVPWIITFSFIAPAFLFISAVVLWVVFFFFLMCYIAPYRAAWKRHKARKQQAHTVTFSRRGIWEAGVAFALDENGTILKKVTQTSQPSVLHFHLKQNVGSSYQGSTYVPSTLRVLIPRGHEAEAGSLLQRFQGVLQAQKQADQQYLHPAEPR
jgi:hypothetical protein